LNKRPPATGKSVYDIRRENLIRLTAEPGRKTQLALRLGVSQARITHMLRTGPSGRRITTDQARELEQVMGLSTGELDHDPAQPLPPPAGVPNLKLVQDIVFAVTQTQGDLGVQLEPEQAANVVRMAYEHDRTTATVDLAFVRQLVSLAKR
jgi:hypothetical protein